MAAWGGRETPLEEQLRMVKRLGLSGLELSIAGHKNDRLQTWAEYSDIDAVSQLFAQSGINLETVATGNDFTLPSAKDCSAELEKVQRVIEIAWQLGAKYLRIFAGFSPADEIKGLRWRTMVTCLNEAGHKAKKYGVRLAVETHGGVTAASGGVRHFFSTSSRTDLLLQMLKELSPEIGLVFDPANLGAVGMSTKQIIELYNTVKERITYIHLKDFRRVSADALLPCACGEGILDWALLYEAMAEFTGTGFIEYEIPEDIEAGTCRSMTLLKAIYDGNARTCASAVDIAL